MVMMMMNQRRVLSQTPLLCSVFRRIWWPIVSNAFFRSMKSAPLRRPLCFYEIGHSCFSGENSVEATLTGRRKIKKAFK